MAERAPKKAATTRGAAALKPRFFATPAALQKWFEAHTDDSAELLVGFYKKGSGRPSVTWSEAVDEALCVGWIDGVRRTIDDESYSIRFTPRKPTSTWSAVNLAKVETLIKEGRMQPAGLAAYERRREGKQAIYAYEQRDSVALDPEYEKEFRSRPKAWEFFQSQAPWYRKNATYWVMSAKRAETRERRLCTLIEDSDAHRRLARNDRGNGQKRA